MNLLLSLVVPLLFANQLTGVFHKIFSSPFMIRWIYSFKSSYSCMGTAFLYSRMEKSFEKLYLRPNSVYCADVTRCCNTSRWTATGLLTHCSICHDRSLASRDIAGLNSFITSKIKNRQDITKRNRQLAALCS